MEMYRELKKMFNKYVRTLDEIGVLAQAVESTYLNYRYNKVMD